MASNNNNNPLNNTNPNLNQNPFNTNSSYAFTNNILITVTFLLFFLILLLITLHLYFRWYIRHLRRRHLRRQHLIFHFPSDLPPTGLDPSVLHSLPTFIHSSHSNPIIECAVCLSHFEDNEPGRVLPKCNHKFHVACIDMWFLSHSTCPLCRALVEFYPGPEANRSVPAEVVVDVVEPGLDDEGRNGRMVCSKEGSVGRLASFRRMLSSETSQ